MADAWTYADMMKPYSAKSENYQGDSATDQARQIDIQSNSLFLTTYS
jgi:hypothetical protein